MSSSPLLPFFKWAQDADHIFIAIEVPNVVDDKYEITSNTFKFTGRSGQDHYALEFEFNKKIDEKQTKVSKHRLLEFLIPKADDSKGFWSTLLSAKDKDRLKGKCKVDFDKWVDEDDAKKKLTDSLDTSRFGGLGGMDDDDMGGLGGMGGMGGMSGMGGPGGPDMAKMMEMLKNRAPGGPGGDHDDHDQAGDHDSDDEELTDLQPETDNAGGGAGDSSNSKAESNAAGADMD